MKDKLSKFALGSQRSEITESKVYANLAKRVRGHNKKILQRISQDELKHYNFWKKFTAKDVKPSRLRVAWYGFLARFLGITFVLRMMEMGEDKAQSAYNDYRHVKGVTNIMRDEKIHEAKLISLLQDEGLDYAGSVVLGLNDALVELTGALAGMTFALKDATIVAIAGMVMGLAAALSMGASNYLATKEDESSDKSPMKSALYTGITYLVVVAILISPYFLLNNILASLALTLTFAILVIAAYTFYITVAKMKRFWPQFLEMAAISIVTAIISFGFGTLLHAWFGI
ncbi:VIT1/CCC1 transporter family protein [Candidatus Woesearchaeota archaeon]|nr:VIT1/CCC1 transporter family protein [Candidatus Woesearchaeota archaeon]